MTQAPDQALIVIDVQQGMDDPRFGERNNPDAEQRIADLLAAWRAAGRPVIHVQHASLESESVFREDRPGHALKREVLPEEGEPLFKKHVSSAFIGTDLEKYLRERGITDLVMVGMTTEHCVSTTARMGGNLGFNVTVVADATATFGLTGYDGTHYPADVIHGAELASLDKEFATIREAREVIAEVENSLPASSR